MISSLWERWKKVAEKIGNFQAAVVFSLLYFLIITPLGLLVNFFNDFLGLKEFPRWQKYEIKSSTIKELKEQ